MQAGTSVALVAPGSITQTGGSLATNGALSLTAGGGIAFGGTLSAGTAALSANALVRTSAAKTAREAVLAGAGAGGAEPDPETIAPAWPAATASGLMIASVLFPVAMK